MIDLVRKHVVLLASAVLGWAGYSYYDAGQAKAEAQAKGQMTEIGATFLAQRDPSVAFVVSNDPYRFEHPAERPAGHAPTAAAPAHSAPAHSAPAHADAAWDDGFVGPVRLPPTPPLSQADLVIALAGALRLANEALARGSPATAARSSGDDAGLAEVPAAPPRTGFVLVLQSTLGMATGGQARINGRTVEEGEAMPFLDPLEPPVLQRVEGTSIVVSHDGEEYLVDLLVNPVLQVGEPADAQASASAPGSAPPKSAPPAASKPAPATGGPPSPAGGKKGTYRVRGKSSKKP